MRGLVVMVGGFLELQAQNPQMTSLRAVCSFWMSGQIDSSLAAMRNMSGNGDFPFCPGGMESHLAARGCKHRVPKEDRNRQNSCKPANAFQRKVKVRLQRRRCTNAVAPRLLRSAGNAKAGISIPALRGAEGDSIHELLEGLGPVVIVREYGAAKTLRAYVFTYACAVPWPVPWQIACDL